MAATAADTIRAFIATQGERHRSVLTGELAGVRSAMAAAGRQTVQNPAPLKARPATGTTITLDTEAVNRWTAELLNLERPAVCKAFAEVQVPVAEHAVAQWPEKTGESRAGLGMLFEYKRGEPYVVHVGRARHTYLVRYALHRAARRERTESFMRHLHGRLRQLSRGFSPTRSVIEQVAREFKVRPEVVAGESTERETRDLAERRYKLPDGSDARGQHAWTAQVYRPGTGGIERMADIVVAYWKAQ